MRPGRRVRPGERGAGVVSTTFGFAVFLGFLLFAVNLSVGLYARTTTTAVGFDAARRLAVASGGCADGAAAAEADLTARVRRWWPDGTVAVTCGTATDPDSVTLRVDADRSRSLLLPGLRRATGLDGLHRRFVVRIEEPR